jgi:hypothetical protein
MAPMLEYTKPVVFDKGHGNALFDYMNGSCILLVSNAQQQWEILIETDDIKEMNVTFNYLDPEALVIVSRLISNLAKFTYKNLESSFHQIKDLHTQAEIMQDTIEPILNMQDISEQDKTDLGYILDALYYVTKFLTDLDKANKLHIDTIDCYNRYIDLHKPLYRI